MNVTSLGTDRPADFPAEAVISVSPVAGGWCVRSPLEAGLMFLAGGHAETQARTLGRCLASLGQTAIIEVWDRNGAIAGSVTYRPKGQGGAS